MKYKSYLSNVLFIFYQERTINFVRLLRKFFNACEIVTFVESDYASNDLELKRESFHVCQSYDSSLIIK